MVVGGSPIPSFESLIATGFIAEDAKDFFVTTTIAEVRALRLISFLTDATLQFLSGLPDATAGSDRLLTFDINGALMVSQLKYFRLK